MIKIKTNRPENDVGKLRNRVKSTGSVGRWDVQRPTLDAQIPASNTESLENKNMPYLGNK